jgi:hypothetical protein
MAPAVCFAPVNHPDGSHNNFDPSIFHGTNIWMGYRDEPERPYLGFISFQDLIEEAESNFRHGNKKRFPLFLNKFSAQGRGLEDFMYNAQCAACKDKANCDSNLMQYFPIKVWDYARDRRSCIFVSRVNPLAVPDYEKLTCRKALCIGIQCQW